MTTTSADVIRPNVSELSLINNLRNGQWGHATDTDRLVQKDSSGNVFFISHDSAVVDFGGLKNFQDISVSGDMNTNTITASGDVSCSAAFISSKTFRFSVDAELHVGAGYVNLATASASPFDADGKSVIFMTPQSGLTYYSFSNLPSRSDLRFINSSLSFSSNIYELSASSTISVGTNSLVLAYVHETVAGTQRIYKEF